MNNILILFVIIIIFIIILFIDYNYCIENFAPKHKHKISKNKNLETFYTPDDLGNCLNTAKNANCNTDNCITQEVTGRKGGR